MKTAGWRVAQWTVLLLGLLAVGHVASSSVPRENHLRFGLSADRAVRSLEVEVSSATGEELRSAVLRPAGGNPLKIDYLLSIPPGNYQVYIVYEMRPAEDLDKNHVGGWTRVGVQHQIRLEGEDHHFPPPDQEAK